MPRAYSSIFAVASCSRRMTACTCSCICQRCSLCHTIACIPGLHAAHSPVTACLQDACSYSTQQQKDLYRCKPSCGRAAAAAAATPMTKLHRPVQQHKLFSEVNPDCSVLLYALHSSSFSSRSLYGLSVLTCTDSGSCLVMPLAISRSSRSGRLACSLARALLRAPTGACAPSLYCVGSDTCAAVYRSRDSAARSLAEARLRSCFVCCAQLAEPQVVRKGAAVQTQGCCRTAARSW